MKFRELTDREAIEYVRSHMEVLQDNSELFDTMNAAREHTLGNTGIVLEIGSRYGGSICMLSRLLCDSGTVISIEPQSQVPLDVERIRSTISPVKLIHIDGYSTDSDVYDKLVDILSGRSIDILMIDGGHTEYDVKYNYDNYSPLVSSPGIIIFHDIRDGFQSAPGTFFDSVKAECNHREFITDPTRMGTGVILC